MSDKVRVSQHSGRTGLGKHNDRSFLEGLSEERAKEIAPHIDMQKSKDNWYWCVGQDKTDVGQEQERIEDAELRFYENQYGEAVLMTNLRYASQSHPERCKTVEEIYKGTQTRPEEMILQIGDMHANIGHDDFNSCIKSYLERLEKWNIEHGNHMHVLSVAIHFDEQSPHAHIRRCWDYVDKDGYTRLGQNKALAASGIERPDLKKAEGRYNNRKISFDGMARKWWQEICSEHGFDVEIEPRPSLRHKDKIDYIDDQINQSISDRQEQIADLQKNVDSLTSEKSAMAEKIADLGESVESLKMEKLSLSEETDDLKKSVESLEIEQINLSAGLTDLRFEKNQLEQRNQILANAILSKSDELNFLCDDVARMERKSKILTSSEVSDIRFNARTSKMDKSKIIIDRDDFENLMRSASVADAAVQQVDKLSSELAAMRPTMKDQMSAAADKQDLRKYRELEKLYPKEFQQLRSAMAAMRHRKKDCKKDHML